MQKKPKLLFLMQLPPPIHGSAVLCSFIKESEKINNAFNAKYLDISTETKLLLLGNIYILKIFKSIKSIAKAWITFISFRPSLVYLALTPVGLAFYRDSLLVLILKLFGARFVFHLHCKGIDDLTKTFAKRRFYKFIFKNCDVIQSDEILHADIKNCFDSSKQAYFVANGAPDFGQKMELKSQSIITIIYLSNYIPSKGAHLLIEAVNNLPEKYRGKFRVKLYGGITDTKYFEKLQTLSNEKYADYVEVFGPIHGKEKTALLASADIFVLPTTYHNECFPLSILEAMSFSLVVISTNEGAISKMIINNETGNIYNPDRKIELVNILSSYFDDKNKLHANQVNARTRYENNYTLDHYQTNILNVLTDILIHQH